MSSTQTTAVRARPAVVGMSVATVLVVSGILVVGYAPFLHAYNAVYYGAMLPCRSVGMVWLSTPFTIAVPLLGFALVALGAGFLAACRSGGNGPWGLDVPSLVGSLELPLRMLAAIALVSGLGYVMSSEVYDRVPLEGVRFAVPRPDEWVTVALPAMVALALYGVGVGWSETPDHEDVRVRPTRARSRFVRLCAVAGWSLPVAAIARGGWDIHFDVPPGFVLVVEWALVLGLGLAWASGAGGVELARVGLGVVLAELVRVCFGASATSFIHSRARDFTFYERHLFTVGRFVNGWVALGWTAVIGGCCVGLIRASRERPQGADSVCSLVPTAQVRCVVARVGERCVWWFLVVSVIWFVVSMTGLDLFRAHDRAVGECAVEGSRSAGRLLEAVVSAIQLGAGWVVAMGAAHLMASGAMALRVVLHGGSRSTRSVSDTRAWQAMLSAALVLCATSSARLVWLASVSR